MTLLGAVFLIAVGGAMAAACIVAAMDPTNDPALIRAMAAISGAIVLTGLIALFTKAAPRFEPGRTARLFASRMRAIVLVMLGVGFVIVGVTITPIVWRQGDLVSSIGIAGGSAFFGVTALASLWRLRSQQPLYTLSPAGLEAHGMGSFRVAWKEVLKVSIHEANQNQYVHVQSARGEHSVNPLLTGIAPKSLAKLIKDYWTFYREK